MSEHDKMLVALSADVDDGTSAPSLSTRDQTKHIMRHANSLGVDGKKNLCQIIMMHDLHNVLVECAEGISINLDKLDSSVILHIYNLVAYLMQN